MLAVKLDALPKLPRSRRNCWCKPVRPVLCKQEARIPALRGTLEPAVTTFRCLGSAPGPHRNLTCRTRRKTAPISSSNTHIIVWCGRKLVWQNSGSAVHASLVSCLLCLALSPFDNMMQLLSRRSMHATTSCCSRHSWQHTATRVAQALARVGLETVACCIGADALCACNPPLSSGHSVLQYSQHGSQGNFVYNCPSENIYKTASARVACCLCTRVPSTISHH